MSLRTQFLGMLLSIALALVLQLVQLPESVASLRPQWPALLLGLWAARPERTHVLLASWVCGLLLDAAFATTLGCHALALVISAYLILKLRGWLRVLQTWQAAIVLIPVWFAYTFLLFWMDGATARATDPVDRWLPLATTTLAWPVLVSIAQLARIRRSERSGV